MVASYDQYAVTVKTCTSRGVFKGGRLLYHALHLSYGTTQKSAKYTLKSPNQIIIQHGSGKGLSATWHFSIILISLRVEMLQISDSLVDAKLLPL